MARPSNAPRSALLPDQRTATTTPMRRRALLAGLGATGAAVAGAAISSPSAAAPKKGAWPDWIDVTRYGAHGDGEHDDSRAIAKMLEDVGSDDATVYFPRGRYALNDDLTVPPNVLLAMDNGAILQPAAGTTITITGPLSAGPYQIIGGDGLVVGRLDVGVALPQWWGAKADGEHDDTAAINAAIHALYAAGGGIVHLTAGTYLLGTVTIGNNPRFSTLIIPKSGVNIEGDGDVTVLKAAGGLSEAGQWNFIQPPSRDAGDPLTDVHFSNFKLDGNGENNLSDLDNPRWNNIGAEYGARITLDGLTFVNNASRQCIKFGFNQVQYAVTDLIIRNCRFDTLAAAVAGNEAQNDHSAINARVDRCLIANNTFTQPYLDHANGASAIEVHSSNAIVTDNRIINFHRGINAVAASHDHINVVYANNVIVDCRLHAFRFHCQNDKVMDRVRVSGNTVVQASPLEGEATVERRAIPMVRMNVRQPIASLVIEDNIFGYDGDLDIPHEDNLGRAIHIGQCHNLRITNNQIRGTLGSAIGHVGTLTDDRQKIEVIGNQIEDCCLAPSGDDGSDTAILFGHEPDVRQPPLRLLRIEQNSIISSADESSIERAIHGAQHIGDGRIVDNIVIGSATDISWNRDPEIDRLHVDHVGTGAPDGVVRAGPGSRYLDTDTGETWDKVASDTAAEGWAVREHPAP